MKQTRWGKKGENKRTMTQDERTSEIFQEARDDQGTTEYGIAKRGKERCCIDKNSLKGGAHQEERERPARTTKHKDI